MTSNTIGWDFSAAQGNDIEPNGIYHTDSSGASWKNITPSQLTSRSIFAGGKAIAGNTAWFVATKAHHSFVFHTTDGGTKWTTTRLSSKPSILAWLSFINPKTGWLLASPGPATGQEPVDLYHTTNGGNTWTKIASSRNTDLPISDGKTGIAFVNAKTGWMTIDNGLHPGQVVLYVTHDGGYQWSLQSIPVPSNMKQQYAHPLPPTFSTSRDGVLPVIFHDGKTVFYFTADGGKTWTPSQVVPLSKVSNLTMTGAQNLWATDGNTVYITHDRGGAWKKWTSANGDEIVALATARNKKTATIYTLHNGKVGEQRLNINS